MMLYVFLAGVAVGYFGRGKLQKRLSGKSLAERAMDRVFGKKDKKK